jgi:RNAse (barnase) inhibitor barstar
MKRKIEDWSIQRLEKERNTITFPEYQREKSLWPVEKKRLLIDTIIKDIDIPKLYFNRRKDKAKDKPIEVIDGQQRLWSIWEFLDDVYPYYAEGKKVIFSNMPASQKRSIMEYTLQVTVFEDAEDEYLRELFVRLQLGLLLNAGERLHAASGEMKDFVFSRVSTHKFISHLGFSPRRFSKETLAAQICINSFSLDKTKQFARTRYEDLSNFFSEYADPKGPDKERFDIQTRTIINNLDTLWDCFGRETSDLKNRSYILSIYLFVDHRGLKDNEHKVFVDFIFKLWKRLREEAEKGMDRENRELYSFQSMLSSAPGEPYQIEGRHNKLVELFDFYKKHQRIKGD